MYNTLLSYHPNGKVLTPILVITLLCSFTKLHSRSHFCTKSFLDEFAAGTNFLSRVQLELSDWVGQYKGGGSPFLPQLKRSWAKPWRE
jgi:hypothetical protein